MKNVFHKKQTELTGKCLLALLAVGMVLAAGLGSANAYFTTYAEAQGGVTIHLGDRTEIDEEFSEWMKRVSVTSEEDSVPVYVRVKAFCGSEYMLRYAWEGDTWSETVQGTGSLVADSDTGYYYYTDILYGGQSTSQFLIQILNRDGEPIASGADASDFNVVVVYESTPVLYDEAGNPYADWTGEVRTQRPEEGGDD